MRKLFLCIPALAIFAIACQKVENTPSREKTEPAPTTAEMIIETVSGSRGAATKATIADADASFAWTAGDNVAVHVDGATPQYVITSVGADAAAATANFTVEYETGYARDAFAVYPSTIVATTAANYGQSGSPLDLTLPGSYTLAEVSGETSPGPMISTNAAGGDWDFYQLCGLLRLTVNGIPVEAKRLEIDFNGKKVCGDFSIAYPVTPNTSNIATEDDTANDCITIKKDGTNTVLGATSLTINIPLPAGTYEKITVIAYDATSGGNALYMGIVPFARSVDHTIATPKTATLGPLQGTFNFTFKDKDTGNKLEDGLRFVRLFSCQNKLYNGATTFGPYTASSATGVDNIANPVTATLKFAPDDGDQLAFQVIDASGKVYSGIYDNFTIGSSYDGSSSSYKLTVDVKAYTFTVASGKKVYFSPGDLGVDAGAYSFTMPFETWGWSNNTATKRVWFDYTEVNYTDVATGHDVYGIKWRNPKSYSTSSNSYNPHEWNNIIGRTNMISGVNPYYRVTVSGNADYLLLPPDETQLSDIGDDLTAGNVTNYAKYLGKGFVLLMRTGRGLYTNQGISWGFTSEGWYWAFWNYMGTNRAYFNWASSGTPSVTHGANQFRMRVRYVRDVE